MGCRAGGEPRAVPDSATDYAFRVGRSASPWPQMNCMEMVLEVSQSPTGRLNGVVRLVGAQVERAFSGAMDLLACIEDLCSERAPGREACRAPDKSE